MEFDLSRDGLVGPFELDQEGYVNALKLQLDNSKKGFKNLHVRSGICRTLLSSNNLNKQIKQHFGEGLKLWRTNAFKKVGGSGEVKWHHDRHFENADSPVDYANLGDHFSILVALTDMDESTGIMEFIPGSHLPSPGYERDTRPFHLRTLEEHFLDIPPELLSKRVKVPLKKGQFMLFHSGLLHRSLPAAESPDLCRYSLVARLCNATTEIPAELAEDSEVFSYPVFLDKGKMLLDKVALVTGGSSGIGKAIARALLEQGAKVVITGRDSKKLDMAIEEMESSGFLGSVLAIKADAGNQVEMANVFSQMEFIFGLPDIVFANAAFNTLKQELVKAEIDEWKSQVFDNISAVATVCKFALKYMKKHGGNIITVGSAIGHTGGPGNSAYAVVKAASWSLTQSLAREAKRFNINVNELIPGPVITGMNPNVSGPEWKLPEDVKDIALLLAKQDLQHGASGQSWSLKRS